LSEGKICFFIGHRDAPESIYPALADAVERHITRCGVTDFRVGNYGAFDRMAARAVWEAKARHPGVRLYLMLAYLPEAGGRSLPDMDYYDGSIYPEGLETVPYRMAISRLNRMTVREADYLIAYVDHSWGGAAATLNDALRRAGKGLIQVENLGEGRGA